MLRNAMGGGWVYGSVCIGFTKVYCPTLLVLRWGEGVRFPEKKHYVTLNGRIRLLSFGVE